MNPASSEIDEIQPSLLCYCRYFAGMWLLGVKMILKALGGWIMICLMLSVPAFLFQFFPLIPFPSELARQIVTFLAVGGYCFVVVPMAFYVGGSTVGFCPRITAADFLKSKEQPKDQESVDVHQ
jgi:hypothetical protein